MKPTSHVPTAHSMDSAWYAVDETGEVARFDTGEPGAFPESAQAVDGEAATGSDDSYTIFYLRAASLARALDGRDPKEFNEAQELAARGGKEHVLASFPAGADVAAFGMAVIWEKNHRWAISTAAWAQAQVNAIVPAATAVFGEGAEAMFDDELRGVTQFACEDYDEPGRYQRVHEATEPLTAEELPPDIKAKVMALKLPVTFGNDASIQLADMKGIGNVVTWGDEPLKKPTPDEQAALEAQRAAKVAEQARKTRIALIGVGLFALLCFTIAIFWPGRTR